MALNISNVSNTIFCFNSFNFILSLKYIIIKSERKERPIVRENTIVCFGTMFKQNIQHCNVKLYNGWGFP